MNLSFTHSYNGFSGVNIFAANKENKTIALAQAISYSIYREPAKISIYKFKTGKEVFARGPRHITGSVIFKSIYNINKLNGIFDIYLEAANEDGYIAQMSLVDVELIKTNEGILLETPYNYTAKNVILWKTTRIKNKQLNEIEDHIGQIYNPYTETWSWL